MHYCEWYELLPIFLDYVIKIEKVLRQASYTYEGRPPAPIPTVRPFRIRQKMNKPSLPANHAKTTSRKREKDFVVFANVQQAKGKLSKRL